jgi:hypothetical protein
MVSQTKFIKMNIFFEKLLLECGRVYYGKINIGSQQALVTTYEGPGDDNI